MEIGDRIKKARKEKGLTQEQLAALVNVSKQVVSNWERGYTPSISNEYIALLATALGKSPDYLLGSDQYPDVSVSFELHEGMKIKSEEDINCIMDEMRKELAGYVKEGRISEEKALLAAKILRDQLTALINVL